MTTPHTYARVPKLKIRAKPGDGPTLTTVLGGTWLRLHSEPSGKFVEVEAFGARGWVPKTDVGEDDVVRFHFVDVGQGDGCLIESRKARVVVDGGRGDNLLNYLRGFKYRELILAGNVVDIDVIVVSHFDTDHYKGITELLMDASFKVGTILHNGIARFKDKAKDRPAKYQTALGATTGTGTKKILATSFDDLDSLLKLQDEGFLSKDFSEFATACKSAKNAGRLTSIRRVQSGAAVDPFGDLAVTALGPVLEPTPAPRYKWFKDDSHTVNGHSVVLRLEAAGRSYLLGGDLNDLSEAHLLTAHGEAAFKSDVFKACHHGSSEFSVGFLQAVHPRVTVISSGDDESYGHPEPDLIGSLGRYSDPSLDRPLVFSTELARSTRGEKITYGMINVRANEDFLLGAQFYDQSASKTDPWHLFPLP